MDEDHLKVQTPEKRINWIDQVKGLTIFLVVYGHNFPFCEKYIYSFHMPLFIMMAGFFHPSASNFNNVKKRFKYIITPYFIWGSFLFAVWFLVTRKYGDNVQLNLSPAKNLIGLFYSQGGRDYMDWGIPMWFLPAIFMTFFIFHFCRKISNLYLHFFLLAVIILSGMAYSRITENNLPWSINNAMVALLFYAFGYYIFKKIDTISQKTSIILALVLIAFNFFLFRYNIKIDMYRAIYGNEVIFIACGITGSLGILFFFKAFPVFRFLEFIGKFSLVILALQLLAMTFIKFVLLYIFDLGNFNFPEWERFVFAIVQIVLMIPGFFIINKYFPILNGGYKKI